MTPRTMIIGGSAVLAAAALVSFGTGYQRQVHAQSRHDGFTITLQTTSYVRSKTGTVLEQRTIARRSDGTEAWESTYPGFPQAGAMSKVVSMDGNERVLLHAAQAIQTGRRPDAEVKARQQRLSNHPADCVYGSEHALRHEAVEGVDTVVVTPAPSTPGLATAAALWSQWRAPELGCQVLKAMTFRRNEQNQYTLESLTEPLAGSLHRGEPEERWFAVPSNYTEMAPSEVRRTLERKLGAQACANCISHEADEDGAYAQAHGRVK